MNLLFRASIWMMLFVILGAFGAHALRDRLSPEMMKVYQTASFYHAIHGLALFFVALLLMNAPSRLTSFAGAFFEVGIFIFSGSLYLLAVTGVKWLGALTPIGGLAFISGWLCLALSSFGKRF